MAFTKRNLDKFLDDTPQLKPRKNQILKKADDYVEKDGVTMVSRSAIILLGQTWGEVFLSLLETDIDHIQIFIEEFGGLGK